MFDVMVWLELTTHEALVKAQLVFPTHSLPVVGNVPVLPAPHMMLAAFADLKLKNKPKKNSNKSKTNFLCSKFVRVMLKTSWCNKINLVERDVSRIVLDLDDESIVRS